jgi:hypothetical protein
MREPYGNQNDGTEQLSRLQRARDDVQNSSVLPSQKKMGDLPMIEERRSGREQRVIGDRRMLGERRRERRTNLSVWSGIEHRSGQDRRQYAIRRASERRAVG